ncbi:MAG: right-handed parallel beta-helix repeat-containing protein [Acidimicrobiia bacterium]
MRLRSAFASAVLLSAGLLTLPATASGASSTTVHPGQSIQAAINAAAPGATVKVKDGTYAENLEITKPLTLEAEDVVLVPPTTPSSAACNQPGVTTGICIHGEVDANFDAVSLLEDVTLEGIEVRGFSGDGVFAVATKHLDVHDAEFASNGGYGIFTFHSETVHYHDSKSHDNGDAGFYVGESPKANVRIDGNRSYRNRAEGILFRDSMGGKIHDNKFFDNCVGIFLLDTGAPGAGGNVKVYDNRVKENNLACPASEDAPPFSGIGIAIGGDTGTRVYDNRVSDHAPGGPSALPTGGIVMIDTTPFGGTVPTNNRVEDNRLKHNTPVDIFSDGTGSGNRFHDNSCTTSTPAGLC